MQTDTERFEWAKEKIIGKQRERRQIGTLSEKTVHAVLKNYYEPDEDKQEIPIEGLYADIFTGSEIIEIQTRSFDKVREKLNRFLPLYPVMIVFPIPADKWLYWIDEKTGEISKKRKSPKKGNPYQAFKELYKIKPYLKEPGLKICLTFLDIEEYRLLNGWSENRKKGSSRYDRIPIRLIEEILFECPKDYMQILPPDLSEPFTCAEFAETACIDKRLAGVTLNILYDLGIVKRVEKRGNAYLYKTVY